ncbi:hypothetical protein [Sphingomonas montana]|uniref:hypothetical protein n=1 Tax=Sphingomonas montana TaxID=1843236 RepID=UPI00096D96CE|nr:hypothetical protein [Sphingomonas montana]
MANNFAGTCAKLRVDFPAHSVLCVVMPDLTPFDPDRLELIALLLTRVGMIMEDTSALAIQQPPSDPAELRCHIAKLRGHSETIMAMLIAAERLVGTPGAAPEKRATM